MDASKSKLILWGGYLLAGIFLAILWVQRMRIVALENRAAETAASIPVRSNLVPVPVANPPAAPPPVSFGDERTQTLMEEMSELLQGSQAGVPNERFLNKSWELLLDNDFERRTRNYGFLLEIMRPEDAFAMHKLFQKAHKEGRDYALEYSLFATRWGVLGGQDALTKLFADQARPPAPADVHNILKGWSQVNPKDALNWIQNNLETIQNNPHKALGAQSDPFHGVLRGWARKDLAAATEAMKTLYAESGPPREVAFNLYLESLFSQGKDQTIDWIKELPPTTDGSAPAARGLMLDLFRRFREANTPGADVAQTFLKVADQPWMGLAELDSVSRMITEEAPAFQQALLSPEAKPVMQQKFASLAKQDPDVMGNWLNENKATPLYDLGAAELARSLINTNPEAAAIWSKTISDPEIKASISIP
jgi:hypothetical protein